MLLDLFFAYQISCENYFYAGFRARTTRPFCFGKSTQNHFLPVRGPSEPAQKQALRDASASVPNKMAQELALLKQPSPKKSIRGSSSAAPNAGKGKDRNDKK